MDEAGAQLQHAWKQHWGLLPAEDYRLILMDEIATFSITSMSVANVLATALARLPGISPSCTVTDGTACVGGDAIAFARHFARVNAIELSENRCRMLLNNVDVCRAANERTPLPPVTGSVYIYHGDCLLIAPRLRQDIVYLDVPWGGKDYKSQAALRLFLSNKPLHDVVLRFIDCAKYVALKLPRNADTVSIESDARMRVVDSHGVSSFRLLVVEAVARNEPAVDFRAEQLLLTLLKSGPFTDTLKNAAAKRG